MRGPLPREQFEAVKDSVSRSRLKREYTHMLDSMAYRRPRGSRIDPVRAGYEIERTARDRLDGLAAHVGVSPSVLLEHVIEHVETDGRGYPTWWPDKPLADGELPIDTA